MKIWSPDLSATQIPPMCCRVYGEVCTGSPTVARLEYSGTDPEEARRKAEEAVKAARGPRSLCEDGG